MEHMLGGHQQLSSVHIALPSFLLNLPMVWLYITLLILSLSLSLSCSFLLFPARKQEIIKITEQLIEAVNNGDFEAYT